jgi:hypothetical protein
MNDQEKEIIEMKKIKDALDALQGIKYEEGVGFVPISSDTVKHPDAKKHFRLSMYKSGVRIMAGLALCNTNNYFIVAGGVLLIIAEIVGILEEMV